MSCGRKCKYQPCQFPRCATEAEGRAEEDDSLRFFVGVRNATIVGVICWALILAVTFGCAPAGAQELRHGPMLKPLSHISNHQESSRTDCSTDFSGFGWWASLKGWEVEAALGARRLRCGLRRDTGPGALFEVTKRWEWRR